MLAALKKKPFSIFGCLFSVAFTANAAEFSLVQDWETPAAWPVTRQYLAESEFPELLVIEQHGIDLSLVDGEGNIANAPGNLRHGPEFLLVPREGETSFRIDETFSNSPAGSFRMLRLPLESETLQVAAGKLAAAAYAVKSADKERLEAACADYYDVAFMAELPSSLRQASAVLSAECDRVEGKSTPADLLAMLDTANHPLGFKSYHADWYRGRLAFSNEDYESARMYYDLSLFLAESDLGNAGDMAYGIEIDIAALYMHKGSVEMIQAFKAGNEQAMAMLDQAEVFLDIAIAQANVLEDHTTLGNAYRFKGAVGLVRGEQEDRITNLLQARSEFKLTNDLISLMYMYGSIGDYYKEWGDLQLAQENYLSALKIVEDTQSESSTADPFHNMSTFYYTLGDMPRAREMILHARQVYANLGNEVRSNAMNFDLATIMIEQGQLQQAYNLLEPLLAFLKSRPVPWDPFRIETQSAMARLENMLGRPETALAYSAEIYNYLEEDRVGTTGFEIVPVFVTHASLLAENNSPEQALAVLENVLNKHATEQASRIQVLAGMHDVYIQQENTAAAVAVADRVFAMIESQQMEIESVRLGPYWSGKTQEIYMAHVDYLLGLDNPESDYQKRAFEVVERARAASLRLRRQEMLLARTRDDSEARFQWQQIMESLRQSAGEQDDDEDALRLERSISEARERFFLSHSNASDRWYPELAELDELQGFLDEEMLVLEYIAGPENVWRLDITAAEVRVTRIGPAAMVSAGIDAALFEITSGPNAASRNTAYLSSLLLADLDVPANISSLLISPAGAMSSVPFSALNYQNGYVADHASVTLLPSISEYFDSSPVQEAGNDNLSLAVFADPIFGNQITADLAFVDTEQMRSWSDTLDRLPASALEARALQAFYAENESLVLTGAQATQANLFDERVRNADIIHIATHGYFNESLPELIGLALASSNTEDDGFVSMAEIAAQDFNADLVVISACSTARGEIIPGEGSMSLARTFLAQGVNSVVSTLWPVSDSATALFMKEFYSAINESGLDYDDALKSAQNKLRENSRYQSPFYWGAYILTSASRS